MERVEHAERVDGGGAHLDRGRKGVGSDTEGREPVERDQRARGSVGSCETSGRVSTVVQMVRAAGDRSTGDGRVEGVEGGERLPHLKEPEQVSFVVPVPLHDVSVLRW